ncbi:hypothetical protein ABPG72_015952 [Tetrahymena utriculariae]
MQEWLIQGFEEIDLNIIPHSFKICSITNILDGSESLLVKKQVYDSEKLQNNLQDMIKNTKEEDCDYQEIIDKIENNQSFYEIDEQKTSIALNILISQTQNLEDCEIINQACPTKINKKITNIEEQIVFTDGEEEERNQILGILKMKTIRLSQYQRNRKKQWFSKIDYKLPLTKQNGCQIITYQKGIFKIPLEKCGAKNKQTNLIMFFKELK